MTLFQMLALVDIQELSSKFLTVSLFLIDLCHKISKDAGDRKCQNE